MQSIIWRTDAENRNLIRGAWAHLTSWWVYPVSLAVAAVLAVLALFGVHVELVLFLFRLGAVATVLAFAYDHRWRRTRPRRRKKRHPRGGTTT